MPKDLTATIHLKVMPDVRNRVLGKLRARGTTMQAFFGDLLVLLDTDDTLLELIERKREKLRKQRTRAQE
jgi:hypothetical protein